MSAQLWSELLSRKMSSFSHRSMRAAVLLVVGLDTASPFQLNFCVTDVVPVVSSREPLEISLSSKPKSQPW